MTLNTSLMIVSCINILFLTAIDNSIIDFESSMGAHDPFFSGFYKQLVKRLDDPNNNWFKYIAPQEHPYKLFTLLKDSYTKNSKYMCWDRQNRIPRIIHQIWVGPKPFPKKYMRWQKTWQSIPGWEYKLWTDRDVDTFPLINRKAYNEEKNLGARADILRMEILFREGGVYVDTDFECIKPQMFDVLNSSYDFYTALTPLDSKVLLIANGLIGAIPQHPIIKACIDGLPEITSAGLSYKMQIMKKGSGLFTLMTCKHMNNEYRDIVFPSSFFYPLGVKQLKNGSYAKLPFCDKTLTLIKQETVKPETIAFHWWEGSWGNSQAILNN